MARVHERTGAAPTTGEGAKIEVATPTPSPVVGEGWGEGPVNNSNTRKLAAAINGGMLLENN